jgi:hypothetical protein
MNKIKLLTLTFFCLFSLLFTINALAETAKEYANHIVYYNAFPTDSLPPQMTKQYGLKRSKNYALINVSVMEKGAGTPTGVRSSVTGQVKNLMGQTRALEFREIREGKAVYYIAQVGVQGKEVVNFYLDIRPEGIQDNYEIKFSKKF